MKRFCPATCIFGSGLWVNLRRQLRWQSPIKAPDRKQEFNLGRALTSLANNMQFDLHAAALDGKDVDVHVHVEDGGDGEDGQGCSGLRRRWANSVGGRQRRRRHFFPSFNPFRPYSWKLKVKPHSWCRVKILWKKRPLTILQLTFVGNCHICLSLLPTNKKKKKDERAPKLLVFFLHAPICLFFYINSNTQIATKKSILLPKSKRDRGGAWLHPSEVVSPKFLVIFSWTPPASLGVRRVPLDEIVMGAAPGWKDLILRARPYATWIKIDHQSLHLDTNNKKYDLQCLVMSWCSDVLMFWCNSFLNSCHISIVQDGASTIFVTFPSSPIFTTAVRASMRHVKGKALALNKLNNWTGSQNFVHWWS